MSILNVHHATPTLAVIDPRGLAVRGVTYWREDLGQTRAPRPTRQVFDGGQRLVEQWDARLTVPALSLVSGLSTKVVARESVDAGWRVFLFGEADQVLAQWDGRCNRVEVEYDTSLRPLTVTERATADTARVVERFEYGGVDSSAANQCGRVTRHDDPAGTRHMTEYDVLGLTQCEVSHFLQTLEPPDWPLDPAARNDLLETDPGLVSRWAYAPLGNLLSLTDAQGHRRRYVYSVAGNLKEAWLQPANTSAPGQCLVRDIRYNPSGKVERETAGNGVVTEAEYALSDGRLERLCAGLPNAEPLQDLRYSVDPGGNIIQIDDQALPIRYFKNQRIDPRRAYSYDTLGQLISATGWEAAGTGAVLNYSEEYDYDAGGNMTELRHLGAQSFTRRWTVAPDSNRSLSEGDQPPDFSSHFDANGNLQLLQPGQTMTWDLRNQLSSVSPVVRENEEDDTERYIYGGGGKRLRKVRTALTHATTVIAEVRYLPGLELHRRPAGQQHEVLDLDAGRNRVTWFHGPDAPEHPLRYQLTDHLGSVTLELDEQANVQSREAYYPFGGTAWEDHRDQTGADKTVRYSGKTKDATGLYYYGFRYFAPWLSRWINPDPAGEVDGLNLYGFVGNSPVGYVDVDGRTRHTRGDFLREGGDFRNPAAHAGDRWAALSLEAREQALAMTLARVHEHSRTRSHLRARRARAQAREQAQVQAFLDLAGDQAPATELDEINVVPLAGTSSDLVTESAVESVPSPGIAPVSPVPGPSSAGLSAPPDSNTCSVCGKNYSTYKQVVTHMKVHSGVGLFACTSCPKKFPYRYSLERHLRTHTGEKPFECTTCGRTFGDRSILAGHMTTHSIVKNFQCNICARTFSRSRSLEEHRLTHAREKFPCQLCGQRFQHVSSVTRHIKTVHAAGST